VAASARAGDPCIGDAKGAFDDCKVQSKEASQAAKDACWNKDHDCIEACRAGRDECTMLTGLDADLNVCRDTLRADKAQCRTDNPSDPDALDLCIDSVQVKAFLCRRTARTTAKPGLALCRGTFRACARACPDGGAVIIDKPACLIAAKNAYLDAKANCREQFQTQKDDCLNHDHACVEVCRTQRDTCRQPIEDNFDLLIVACNTTRDADVALCNGDPDCITAAVVKGFVCRDAARELARSGLDDCRATFQSCVVPACNL
jgi:hypothetical protein